MDSITHTLFGLSIYGATNKEGTSKEFKKALFFTTVTGSLIPDIDVVSQLWDTAGMYQLWHRGITHSLFMVPVFAVILYFLSRWIWKVKDPKLFYIALLSIFIHNTSDVFNAWGTGYFEPFIPYRVTFGVIPIIDFVFWLSLLFGFILVKFFKKRSHLVFKFVWLFMCIHVSIQCLIGYSVYQNVKNDKHTNYEIVTLTAEFTPWHFTVVAKEGHRIDLIKFDFGKNGKVIHSFYSDDQVDLTPLFEGNPAAETLTVWSPIVVVVNNEEHLGVFDPRFYRNGKSFLYEYIEK